MSQLHTHFDVAEAQHTPDSLRADLQAVTQAFVALGNLILPPSPSRPGLMAICENTGLEVNHV